ncbi:CehA/McbA family metallohydrolase [Streptomyces lonarensis]|uniref:CehA/McbA family metallohydrolase n=1 Tax=Streptomyces lonarensis TaxID=700599 RepID=A0A7X6CY01_9ACTN|nr:CehA/McbA family metallohydrolase [Streptomyces lonarensis]NJQ04623.1 CehA/McbA family metallohydrolase [Streptomyces lonarensis]
MNREVAVHRGRWSLTDRLDAILRELPFEVAPGAAGVTVELEYDRRCGVLDLGCEGAGGYRGWSGGARDRFTIAERWATPGYLPGAPEPGPWRVLLRLHRVPPAGLEYTVRVTAHGAAPPEPTPPPVPPPRERPPRRELPVLRSAGGELRWYAGDFHAHTVHSDGALTIDELASLAAGQGLDFLAVTDHNTTSHHPHLPAAGARHGITLVPGQEVTRDDGHANVFGDTGFVDFRRPADDWYRAAREGGGVMSLNHPLSGDCAWRLPLAERPRHVELWHSSWADRRWGAPLAWSRAWRPDTVAVGGSDFHRPGEGKTPGTPTTWVLAEDPSPTAVVAALAAGRTAVCAGPGAPLLLRHGDELLARDADGLVLVRPDGTRTVVRGDRATAAADAGPHRLETYENEVIALCQ